MAQKRIQGGKKSPVLSTPGRQNPIYLAHHFISSILVQCLAQSKNILINELNDGPSC